MIARYEAQHTLGRFKARLSGVLQLVFSTSEHPDMRICLVLACIETLYGRAPEELIAEVFSSAIIHSMLFVVFDTRHSPDRAS
jgi:hypothetical protein